MTVWLWDAYGPARTGLGVTDDEVRARLAAEACLRSGGADTARVEHALLISGICVLTPGYRRTGRGWMARRRDGRVTWTPFCAPDPAAS